MFELMKGLDILSLFDLYASVSGGRLSVYDGAKILCMIGQDEEIVVVVRPSSGLTLIMNVPGPGDWDRVAVGCRDGYVQYAEPYGEHYVRVVGGPPETRCFYWRPGGVVHEREPNTLVPAEWHQVREPA